MNYPIYKTSTTGKDFTVNDKEELFFNAFSENMEPEINTLISLYRMSDGTLSVYFSNYPVGKIKLQGRKHWMQILKGLDGVKVIDGDVGDFITHIADWKRYIKSL